MTKTPDFQPPPTLDLRRDRTSTTSTTIVLHADYRGHAWIHAGEIELTERSWSQGSRGCWMLDVKAHGVMDDEHDTIVLLRIGLFGVAFRMANGGKLWFDAFIAGDDPGLFRIPQPGWNQLEGATKCTQKNCRDQTDKHLIVEEGRYIPPPNVALFERLRGLRVEIVTGRAA